MADSSTISSNTAIWASVISASSAIIAGCVTQILVARNIRKSDERKEIADNNRNSKIKRIEIGENFYHMFRETLLNHHRLKNAYRIETEAYTPKSIEYLDNQFKSISEIATKLTIDTSKYNLTEIYFDIESSSEETAKDVLILTNLTANKLHQLDKYETTSPEGQFTIAEEIIKIQNNMIEHVEKVAKRVERDLEVVKKELRILNS